MEWYLVHSCVRPGIDSLFIFCIEEFFAKQEWHNRRPMLPVFKSMPIWGQRKDL